MVAGQLRLGVILVLLIVCIWEINASQDVLIEAFDWNSLSNRANLYPQIQSQAPAMASAGITHVWFPPPSQSADAQGYMPGEWYNIVGASALSSAISAVKKNGMKPIMDTVLNHRTATYISSCNNNWTNFTNPDWDSSAVVYDDYECSSSDVFCPSNTCVCGAPDTGENFCPAPDVDHTNTSIQSDIIDWMQWMQQNYQFQGWRFDMVIGYNGEYVGKYVTATDPVFSVGEYWTDDVDDIVTWLTQTGWVSTAFDFPNRDNLQTCVDSNDYTNMLWGEAPAGLMGVEPNYASTFTDNHDTARNDRFGDTDEIIQGYAYILTHPGYPFIFWDDWNTAESQTAIKTFISIRNQQNLTPTSDLWVKAHQSGLYAVFLGGATADCGGNVALKLGTTSWDPDYCNSSWKLATSGTNYAIWTK